ncbi:MAG: c-type cytochrome [Planctomycetes bacterium]|nr:c-type cytochrome [Planctomycetota bacterium]
MPANEQTWRSLSLMHVVFCVSGLVMLIATIWMLAKDHDREWKNYQRDFQKVEIWTAESRVDESDSPAFQARKAELQKEVAAAAAEHPSRELVDDFLKRATAYASTNGYDLKAVQDQIDVALPKGTPPSPTEDKSQVTTKRAALLAAMQAVVNKAKFDEGKRQSELKFKRAELDVERSKFSIAVDEGKDDADLKSIEDGVRKVENLVNDLNLAYQAAKTHRLDLEGVIGQINANEAAKQKELADYETPLKQRETALTERQPPDAIGRIGRKLLEAPIIDAFGRPLKIEQIWLPQLTLNNNFRDVARFDRCTTCHLGIDKTAPGSAVDAGYEPAKREKLTLSTPKQAPQREKDKDGKPIPITTDLVYGFSLSAEGQLNPNDATVDVVWPRSVAANAGLKPGDVIELIEDAQIVDRATAEKFLVDLVTWGKPLTLTVRRGIPQPFSSHPKLDLFVGSLSPHKMADVGCTICHDGQGSATDFKWASHTPNNPNEADEWSRKHGWFNNHHWIFPQQPTRFAESTCLKCHHEVIELEPSERFPDPPAPKLVEGYNLIRQYGCFGCHEINGYDGPSKRKGPDMRAEPTYFAAAQSLLASQGLSDEMKLLARDVVAHPEVTSQRKLLAELIAAAPQSGEGTVTPAMKKLAGLLGADDETPGQLRKVGPSLRYVASKVDKDFLYHWIRNPSDFRPSTKMPRFFGLWDHLTPEEKVVEGRPINDASGHPVMQPSPGLTTAQRYEPLEILAITDYLLARSDKFEYAARPKGAVEPPSVERGKVMFQTRGCLACHQHGDFPAAKDTQGPDLNRLGSKLKGQRGRDWLYSWVREPNRYHARTVMPNLFLETIKGADGKTTDPAADIVEYLLKSQGWSPKEPAALPTAASNGDALTELTKQYLTGAFTVVDAEAYAKNGISPKLGAAVRGDETILVGEFSPEELARRKLLYVGRRSISRLGCSGCHDIPGFEDAKPIGTALADWGRKEPSKLAFEQIVAYLSQRQAEGKDPEIAIHKSEIHGMKSQHAGDDHEELAHLDSHDAHGHLTTRDVNQDAGFYLDAMMHHGREGFIWQKLREPRSYDYRKTENKDYFDRLRMPKFNFTPEQREAVITFVLGLVAEPPAARYVYKPSPNRAWELKGQQVVNKFNCAGCHTMEMEQWTFDYKPADSKDPNALPPPPPFTDFAFLNPHFTPAQMVASTKVDRRGLGRATITGMPRPETIEDDDGKPINIFELWKPAAIDGHVWPVGGLDVPVPDTMIVNKRAPVGGNLARMLHPVAMELERPNNANVKGSDAWGWVPPPLVGEGRKVQSAWLHNFLLDPYPIRPAVILRMPKFNMSSDEATALVNYFAARDKVEYPYEFDPRTRSEYLSTAEAKHPGRMKDALNVITNNNYCVKCHLIGDFVPAGSEKALAPQLDRVSQRLRPDFLQRWIANPKRQLPFTGMPVNFPPDKPADQALYHGTSAEQVSGVADLLLNWPEVMQGKTSIKALVPPPAPAVPASGAAPAGNRPQ